jgi:hypothetical protein
MSLTSLLHRFSGGHRAVRDIDLKHQRLQHQHRRLVAALVQRDHVELLYLLAGDVQLHLLRSVHVGRPAVLAALEMWLGQATIVPGLIQWRLYESSAVLHAQWSHDCPERGRYVQYISALLVLERDEWQIVRLRQEMHDLF